MQVGCRLTKPISFSFVTSRQCTIKRESLSLKQAVPPSNSESEDTNPDKMRVYQAILFTIALISAIGDVTQLFNSWGSEGTSDAAVFESQSSLGLPGAHGYLGPAARALGRAIKAARKAGKKKGGSEHTKNKRPSSKGKHEKGQSRKKKDQERAGNKKQKGGKDGSKKRGKKG